MKRITLLIALLLVLTGCTPVNVPPADYGETTISVTETETASETDAETETETVRAAASTAATEQETNTGDDEETETSTEPLVIPDWAEGYATLIRQKNAASEHIDAAYALIRLDADEIPELVILDDQTAELYYADEGTPVLLFEDFYKNSAVSKQNFSYQPAEGRIASYFSTMGGGSGFNLLSYDTLDPKNSERCCFNSVEAEGGEMPYNPIWDHTEAYDISIDEDRQVSLGDTWTHIGTGFADIRKLVAVTGNKLTLEWNDILQDIHDPDDLTDEDEEEEE